MLERKIHWHQNISAVLLTSSSSTAVQTLLSLVATPTFKCLPWSCLLVPVLSATSMSIAPCRCHVLQSLGRAVQSYRCFALPRVQELGWDEAQHARSMLLEAEALAAQHSCCARMWAALRSHWLLQARLLGRPWAAGSGWGTSLFTRCSWRWAVLYVTVTLAEEGNERRALQDRAVSFLCADSLIFYSGLSLRTPQ